MILGNTNNSLVRSISAKVELFNGSTLADTITHNSALVSAQIDRVGEEGKFFGFGICQKANIKLRDIKRITEISTSNSFKIYFNNTTALPMFYVTEVNRDENTNALSITAYDNIKNADKHTVAELELEAYTVKEFAEAAAAIIGASGVIADEAIEGFSLYYEGGANFEGTESIREALNAVAEVTQTIYYLNADNMLVFKRFDDDAAADLVLTKADYFLLDSKTNKRLGAICSATELGDNYIASIEASGTTQYIRNNPFLELREDIAQLVDNAIAAVGGLTINQFSCSWRGNYLLEVGDKIGLITKDNKAVYSFVINDTITYDGTLKEQTSWTYTETEGAAANSTNLGEVLKQTYAKVDKQEKRIDIVASEAAANSEEISSIKLTTDSMTATVSGIEKQLNDANENISTLTKQVEAQITEDDITIKIQAELANGVDKVVTGKGFTLDDEGLTVQDLNPETNNKITTTISNNGMTVNSNNKEMLKANDEGVKAQDLHATTFLIIGKNSRFEDYGNRTGCFWIGG